ncbi:MAG: UvrD-helicase domain-containing protein [Candidatus Cryptobacteroides sp.]
MIKIMKASAGSGKTYNLARTYIRLALSRTDRHAYRHILAVTFTNKATDEMKARILKELHVLASNTESSPYFSDLLPEFGSAEALAKRASQALSDILHDYGSFSVSTIDRFFQHALKAFAREIGQFANYQVELDRKSLVSETVDRILDSLSEDNPALLKWLTGAVISELSEGKKFNLESRLDKIAESLLSEEHRTLVEKFGIDEVKEYSQDNLAALKKSLREARNGFIKGAKCRAGALVDAFGRNGLQPADFCRNVMDKVYEYAGISLNDIPPVLKKTHYNCNQDYSCWFRKAQFKEYAHLEGELMPLYRDFYKFVTVSIKDYYTAGTVLGIVDEMAIAMDLYREFNQLLKEKNVVSLDDSNAHLRDIIDGSDAPFIYEKLGVRYDSFLLDEFQDTSRIQWNNFLPLLKESDSKGGDSLIVGDVKQSIYRWRGSDWKMLSGDVQQCFPHCSVESLDSNYRSLGNIVRFNNGFFRYAARIMDSLLEKYPGSLAVSSIYSETDCVQNVRVKDSSEGCVTAVFCDRSSQKARVLESVREALASGARPGDIAVLVRTNSHGAEVAKYLMDNGIKVISDDSLYLKSSSVVRQAVSLMSALVNETDSIGSFIAREMGIGLEEQVDHLSLIDFCEGLLRKVRDYDSRRFDSQTQYIQSFMDYVQDFVASNGNSPDLFLKVWADADPKISSPSDPDSVRVMTIHKSKGLEFPHVIFPYAEGVKLAGDSEHWCRPEVEGTALENILVGIYKVGLHLPDNENTYFHQNAVSEMNDQFIDNINVFYVALTRAAKSLTVIAEMPKKDILEGDEAKIANLSHLLYCYFLNGEAGAGVETCDGGDFRIFRIGKPYDFTSMPEKASGICGISPGYPSIPLNPAPGNTDGDVRERGRLKFSADSIDFFNDEATASKSSRLNGSVMHSILSKVNTSSDIESAVVGAVDSGDLDPSRKDECIRALLRAVSSHPEWFDANTGKVYPELSLIDTDGNIYRPDRVMVNGPEVTIVDYKFGEKDPRYRRQVDRYADIYRRMGYREVNSYIWYVPSDTVE